MLVAGAILSAPRPPRVVAGARTTSLIDDYRFGERREHVEAVCEPLDPDDLRGAHEVALACAVAGEVLPETPARLRSISRVVLADAQGLVTDGPRGCTILRGAEELHVPAEERARARPERDPSATRPARATASSPASPPASRSAGTSPPLPGWARTAAPGRSSRFSVPRLTAAQVKRALAT